MEVYVKISGGEILYVGLQYVEGSFLCSVDMAEEEKEQFAKWADEDEIILHIKEHEGKPICFYRWVSDTNTLFVDTNGEYHMAFGRDMRWSKYTNAQEVFAAWAKGKKIIWVAYELGEGSPVEFSHWKDRNTFYSVDDYIWEAFGHGFETATHGHWKEAI